MRCIPHCVAFYKHVNCLLDICLLKTCTVILFGFSRKHWVCFLSELYAWTCGLRLKFHPCFLSIKSISSSGSCMTNVWRVHHSHARTLPRSSWRHFNEWRIACACSLHGIQRRRPQAFNHDSYEQVNQWRKMDGRIQSFHWSTTFMHRTL